ncbi:VOC family protein [Streptomyces marincola]|uniref:VOC family protein n=1 Tax=Streptomyces marincola TaxID=2878388 RepID=UPI001CF573A3|nr:VOC family protein [Streptomyces marincola]UCM90945.1 VOC family protein [Streptomyces marincola]
MSTKIFVNLPVKDLARSRDFFTALGYSFNPDFSDENAACLVISENILAMLLVEPFFKTFTEKRIVDAHAESEVILALSADSREQVDELVDRALAAGGSPTGETQDHGFMYGRAFLDPDGHHWELTWMDMAAAQEQG